MSVASGHASFRPSGYSDPYTVHSSVMDALGSFSGVSVFVKSISFSGSSVFVVQDIPVVSETASGLVSLFVIRCDFVVCASVSSIGFGGKVAFAM